MGVHFFQVIFLNQFLLPINMAKELHWSFLKKFRLKNLYVCLYGMYVCVSCAGCPWRSEEGTDCPAAGVTDGDELPCGCWESQSGSLGEHLVLLNGWASLQPQLISEYQTLTFWTTPLIDHGAYSSFSILLSLICNLSADSCVQVHKQACAESFVFFFQTTFVCFCY